MEYRSPNRLPTHSCLSKVIYVAGVNGTKGLSASPSQVPSSSCSLPVAFNTNLAAVNSSVFWVEGTAQSHTGEHCIALPGYPLLLAAIVFR